MTTERIAAAIKPIIDEDRRADRERIAELERDAAHLRKLNLEIVDTYNRELDELTEKCAALVVEREQAKASWNTVTSYLLEKATLRIDTDMSDPQPGKLLVVRLDEGNTRLMQNPFISFKFHRDQFVGFLVETPAVEAKTISGGVTTTNSPFPWESRK